MSQYYYLVDKENKFYYELGKGCWPYVPKYLSDIDLLKIEILYDLWMLEENEIDNIAIKITDRVSNDLFSFFKNSNKNNLKIIVRFYR